MCKASLEEDEDVEGEDVDRETGIIRVQLAFAIQMQVCLLCLTSVRLGKDYHGVAYKDLIHWTVMVAYLVELSILSLEVDMVLISIRQR